MAEKVGRIYENVDFLDPSLGLYVGEKDPSLGVKLKERQEGEGYLLDRSTLENFGLHDEISSVATSDGWTLKLYRGTPSTDDESLDVTGKMESLHSTEKGDWGDHVTTIVAVKEDSTDTLKSATSSVIPGESKGRRAAVGLVLLIAALLGVNFMT